MSYKDTWTECSLGDVVELSQGLAINKGTKHLLQETGLPLLRITDLLNNTEIQYINKDEVSSKCISNINDLIYTRTGQVGFIFKNRAGVIHNNSFKVIIKNEAVDRLYLYWFLYQEKVREYANSIALGSVQKDLSHSAFKSIPFQYPPLPIQRRIAAILSSLDDKIENNRKTCEKLEEIAQAIFKRWFVDFEFPNEEGLPYKSSGGDMVYCEELGKEIPKGWKFGPISNLIDYYLGGDWGTEEPDETYEIKVLCIRGADFPDIKDGDPQGIPIRYIQLNSLEKRRLNHGDVLLEISGGTKGRPVGRAIYIDNNFIKHSNEDIIYSNFCRLLRAKECYDKYLYLYLDYLYLTGSIEQYQVQSTGIANFQFSDFLNNEILAYPIEDKLVQFNQVISSLYSKKYSNQNFILRQIRDALLPKLMSGEIEVDEGEVI